MWFTIPKNAQMLQMFLGVVRLTMAATFSGYASVSSVLTIQELDDVSDTESALVYVQCNTWRGSLTLLSTCCCVALKCSHA